MSIVFVKKFWEQNKMLNLIILPILFNFASENAQGGEKSHWSFSEANQGEQQKKRDRTGIFTPSTRFSLVLRAFLIGKIKRYSVDLYYPLSTFVENKANNTI
jgi:hypothetical protein